MSEFFKVDESIKSLVRMGEFSGFMDQVVALKNKWRKRNDNRGAENPETGVQVLADIEDLAISAGYKQRGRVQE